MDRFVLGTMFGAFVALTLVTLAQGFQFLVFGDMGFNRQAAIGSVIVGVVLFGLATFTFQKGIKA